MTTVGIDRQVETRLGSHGIRCTKGRRAVVAALAGADGPKSADELHRDLDAVVPLSSLYRSLTVLEQAGVVAPHHGTKRLTRYEIAEWLAGHHHHLVCTHCGQVEDVEISANDEERLRSVIDHVSAAASFSPSDHSLEITGRCTRCS
jgi:Fur family ferric uptake transcriptional regulator